MPVKPCLKLISTISANRMNAKWKLLNYVVNELTGIRLIVALVAFQIPHYMYRTQVVFSSQVDDLADDLGGNLPGMSLGRCRLFGEPSLAMLVVFLLPPVKSGSNQAKVAAGHTGVTGLFGMFKYTQTTLYFSLLRSNDYSLLNVGYFRLDCPAGNDISTVR